MYLNLVRFLFQRANNGVIVNKFFVTQFRHIYKTAEFGSHLWPGAHDGRNDGCNDTVEELAVCLIACTLLTNRLHYCLWSTDVG